MEQLSTISQLIISVSVVIVWVFRRDNITNEFIQYKLSNLTKNIIGASKISLATIMIVDLYIDLKGLLLFSSLLMAFLMICAQYFHF